MSVYHKAPKRRMSFVGLAVERLENRTLLSAGALDPTFGTKGQVTLSYNPPEEADAPSAVLVQPDGKSIVVGTVQPGFYFEGGTVDFAVARYTTAGKLDPTFGTNGVTLFNFTGNGDVADAAALQSDGKIVVAGWSSLNGGVFELARFTTSGKVDTTFDHSGFVTTTFGDGVSVSAISIDSQGRILVLGGTDLNYDGSVQTSELTLARYLPSGTLDTTFGNKGTEVFTTGTLAGAIGGAMVLQPDGKIIVAGSSGSDFFAARLTTSGALDSTFGTGGVAKVNIKAVVSSSAPSIACGVALVAGGNILLGGTKTDSSAFSRFALTELTPSGKIDTAFGSGGVVDTSFSQSSVAHAMVVQPDGKIILVGSSIANGASNPQDYTLVARYYPDGSLDQTFNRTGTLTYDAIEPGLGLSDGLAVALQSDGDILVASDLGTNDMEVVDSIVLTRILGD